MNSSRRYWKRSRCFRKMRLPACAPKTYLYGPGMLERIYPEFWGAELVE